MFIVQNFIIDDTMKDLVAAVWDGALDAGATPSFEYILQNQGNVSGSAPISIGNAVTTVSAGTGYLLNVGEVFRVILPSTYRLGVISAQPGTTAYVTVFMAQQS